MIAALIPSYCFKAIALLLLFAAIGAETQDQVYLLVAAYISQAIAYWISTRKATHWFWLWKSYPYKKTSWNGQPLK